MQQLFIVYAREKYKIILSQTTCKPFAVRKYYKLSKKNKQGYSTIKYRNIKGIDNTAFS